MPPEKPAENLGKLMKISLDKIKPRSLNCNELLHEAFRSLVEDIRTHGLRYPILVRQIGPDSYEIVDGEHRWRATKELGWKEIECQVIDISEEEAEVANFKLNSQRGQLNAVKVAILFDKERKRGHSQEKIGKIYNITQARVSQYLEILTYPEEIQRPIISRLMTFEHARKIVGMIDDPELQAQVSKRVVDEGLSVRETEAAIRELLETRKKEEDWAKRKEELIRTLDFSARHGQWKSENCEHRDKDGYCKKWSWSDEPTSSKEQLPWLEVREIKGRWHAMASSNLCALCQSFTQKGGEVDQLRARMASLEGLVREFNKARDTFYKEVAEVVRKTEDNFRVPCSKCGKPMFFSSHDGNWESKEKPILYQAFKDWSHVNCQ